VMKAVLLFIPMKEKKIDGRQETQHSDDLGR
jgi:hypothetical protein